MSVLSVLICLQASGERRGVRRSDFLEPLAITPNDGIEYVYVPETAWTSGIVQFPIVRLSECRAADEPHEELALRVRNVLLSAAAFLDRRDVGVFQRIRSSGLTVQVFADIRMDADQFAFELPPEFVRACGRHELGMFLMSNDISAAEALEAEARRGHPPASTD